MSQPNQLANDGAPIIDALSDIRRRVKIFSLAFGIGLVVASIVALLLTTVFLDWLLNLQAIPRLVVILAAIGGIGYATVRFVIRPMIHKLTIGDLAGLLEHSFPQFDDRLRSTVDFVNQDVPGSTSMKDRVVRETAELARTNDLRSAVVARPVYMSAAGAVGALAVCAAIFAIMPAAYRDAAFERLLTPFSGAAWPKSTHIEMLGDVPPRMAAGQQANLSWRLTKGSSHKAIFMYRYDNGAWESSVVIADANGVFTAPIEAQLEQGRTGANLSVRIQAGDDDVDRDGVKIVPRLEISGVDAAITPPKYVGDDTPVHVALGDRAAVMAQYSSVEMRVTFNKSLDAHKSVRMDALKPQSDGSAAPTSQPAVHPNVTWSFDPSDSHVAVAHFVADRAFVPDQPFHFTIHATDSDGFGNLGQQDYQVLVREDQLPTGVQIQKPRQNEERTADASFPLEAIADDDYGLSEAQLVVNRLNADTARPIAAWTVPLEIAKPTLMANNRHYEFSYQWDLANSLKDSKLHAGDILEYYVRVKDNFSLEGKTHPWVSSPKLRVSIISLDDWNLEAGRQIDLIHKVLEKIDSGQKLTRQDTTALAEQLNKSAKFDPASQEQTDRIASDQNDHAAQTNETAKRLDDLAKKMEENKSAQADQDNVNKVAQALKQTAEGPMKTAKGDLSKAGDPKPDPKATAAEQKKDADRRAGDMNKAAASQQTASEQLEKAMDQLGHSGLDQALTKMKDVLKQQKELDKNYAKQPSDTIGKTPEQLTPEQRKENEKLAAEQADIKKKTEQALANLDKAAKDAQASSPSKAEAMKSASKTAKSQQITGKQDSSSQSIKDNQKSDAQDAQQQVELGLEQVIRKLEEAKKTELKELQEKLAKMQKLIQDLVARQAGHNMDNMRMQDNGEMTKFLKLDTAEQKEIVEGSGRDLKALPEVPTIRGLADSQKQTLGNARSLTADATDVPDPAIGEKLTAAAAQMERAVTILHLDEEAIKRLVEAYDPQHQALEQLLAAKDSIDKAKAEVDDQLHKENQEAIRQAYVKLLENQQKLDQQVKDLEAKRVANGGLNRAEAMLLSAQRDDGLPARQGDNSTTANKLSDQLNSIGSIEFVAATKDVVETMNAVKELLGSSKLGVATQAQQGEVEEDLQNIIEALKQTKPDPAQFNKKNGSGGPSKGGNGKPPPPQMPLEPELRLAILRQTALNKAVAAIDKAMQGGQKMDPASLLALGARQGKYRNELNALLNKASKGKVHFNEEPKDDGTATDLDPQHKQDQGQDQSLLTDKPDNSSADPGAGIEKTIANLGDDMARARRMLAVKDDPGQKTQDTQQRIIKGMGQLLALAKQQQPPPPSSGSSSKPGDPQQGPPKPGQQSGNAQASGSKPGQQSGEKKDGSSPATSAQVGSGGPPELDPGKLAAEDQNQWATVSSRKIGDSVNTTSDKPLGGYAEFTGRYFKELVQKASQSK